MKELVKQKKSIKASEIPWGLLQTKLSNGSVNRNNANTKWASLGDISVNWEGSCDLKPKKTILQF